MPTCVQRHLGFPTIARTWVSQHIDLVVRRTFWMMGITASFFGEVEATDARPFGRCESGTRMGLCRRIDRFFCDLPISEEL